MVHAGVEVTQAETKMRVHIGQRGQSFELGVGTLGVGHVHVSHCSVSPRSVWKTGACSAIQPSALSTARVFFDLATKPGALTGIDTRCTIDMAIIRGCLRRMGVTLRWGPTGLILGDALTKDKADAADLLRACVRASAYQLADESSTLQRARKGT